MSHLESSIENRTVDLVFQYLGIKGSKLVIQGETGFMDRIFWIPGGRPLLIEFKQSGEGPEPHQAAIRKDLIDWGYDVVTCDNAKEAFLTVIDHALKAVHPPSKTELKYINAAYKKAESL